MLIFFLLKLPALVSAKRDFQQFCLLNVVYISLVCLFLTHLRWCGILRSSCITTASLPTLSFFFLHIIAVVKQAICLRIRLRTGLCPISGALLNAFPGTFPRARTCLALAAFLGTFPRVCQRYGRSCTRSLALRWENACNMRFFSSYRTTAKLSL